MNKELPAGTTLLHYRIVSKLGAGGMGEVYLAHDTKLDRKVAIKLLHEEFSKDEDLSENSWVEQVIAEGKGLSPQVYSGGGTCLWHWTLFFARAVRRGGMRLYEYPPS